MKDQDKTKKQLTNELEETRQRIKRLEKAQQSLEIFEAAIDASSDLIMICDTNYKILKVSAGLASTLKAKPGDLVGKICYEVMHAVNVPHPQCPHQQAMKTKKPARADFFEPHLGLYLDISVSPLLGQDGQIRSTIHTFKDITERRQMEKEKEELEQKTRVNSRLATVGQMASGIAHEINNPLTGVIGFSQLLQKKDVPEDIKKNLKIICNGAERVASIVQRLLIFARQQKPERKKLDINEPIKSTIAIRAYEMEASNIDITMELAPDLPRIVADRGQLQQVFLNIILNAEAEMKLAHGKGSLLIRTGRIDNTIRISFKDDGLGIPKENLERIFDPFFTTREVGEGIGLGLSICHGIVAEHGGRIWAESEVDKGATFIVELPIITEIKETESAEPAAVETENEAKPKILVVDDELIVQEFLSEVLTEAGWQVESVGNSSDALERIESDGYSVVLLDIKMRGMSGIELYEHLQKTAPSMAKRVVFITGDVMGEDTWKFLRETKAPYLTKPFDEDKLMEKIDSVVKHSA